MALENKLLPQRRLSLDINENNLLKVNRRKDSLSKALLLLLVVVIYIYFSISFYVSYAPVYGADVALIILVATLLAAVIFFIFILLLVL